MLYALRITKNRKHPEFELRPHHNQYVFLDTGRHNLVLMLLKDRMYYLLVNDDKGKVWKVPVSRLEGITSVVGRSVTSFESKRAKAALICFVLRLLFSSLSMY